MSASAAPLPTRFSAAEQLEFGRRVLQAESEALTRLAAALDGQFCRAADILFRCRGAIVVCGMGKAGLIGQKIAATLASTGAHSYFLHPAEAVHGDLGRVHGNDVLLVLSASGETEEIVRLLPIVAELSAPIVAITARPVSTLARAATVVLDLQVEKEACPLGLAPTTSTTAMLALGDALALLLSRLKEFTAADFARLHPAGALGRRLAKVEDVMRPLADCRVGEDWKTVREVLVALGRPGRRTGAIMLTDPSGRLSGVFTDSDLARILERQQDAALDRPLREVMTASPTTVVSGQRMDEAVRVLIERKISELPVVHPSGVPLGLIDVTDIVGWLPRGGAVAAPSQQASPQASRDVSRPPPIRPRREVESHRQEEAVTLPFPHVAANQQFHRLE